MNDPIDPSETAWDFPYLSVTNIFCRWAMPSTFQKRYAPVLPGTSRGKIERVYKEHLYLIGAQLSAQVLALPSAIILCTAGIILRIAKHPNLSDRFLRAAFVDFKTFMKSAVTVALVAIVTFLVIAAIGASGPGAPLVFGLTALGFTALTAAWLGTHSDTYAEERHAAKRY